MTHAEHYAQTRSAFREVAVDRAGFYDARPGEPLKHSRWQLRIRGQVVRALGVAEDTGASTTSLLSIGCGRADFEIELVDRFASLKRVVGCDFADEALRIARQAAGATRPMGFLAADALRLPFNAEAFDTTLCINVLHHVQTVDLQQVITEIARVSARHIVLEIKNADQLYYQRIHPREALGVHVYPTSVETLTTYLQPLGFELRTSYHVFGFKVLSPLSVLLFSATR